ncbi:MAG: ATP-binding protein [Spirochaetaceae bacterium]|nr:MAG: ATP-binding protein [Spirochaetaceae bacterium]
MRVFVVTGHYGSGKSEFSVNLALVLRSREQSVALADVDVVNPYFRSREQRALLEHHGIRVIGNTMGVDRGVDIPAVSADVYGPLTDGTTTTVIDAGGDPVGARLLGSFRRLIPLNETEVLCVVNALRPSTRAVDGVIEQIQGIETASGLRISGLVNNTHLLEHTEVEQVLAGDLLCGAVTEQTGIPVRYVAAVKPVIDALPDDVAGERITIGMHLRDAWMLTAKEA